MISGAPFPLHRTGEGWYPAGQQPMAMPMTPLMAPMAPEMEEPDEDEGAVVVISAESGMDSGASLPTELLKLASFLMELRDQAHLAHLNIEGPNFLPVHKFLGEQYDALTEKFDVISEHVRAMGYRMPPNTNELRGLCHCFRHNSSQHSREILSIFGANLDQAAELATQVEALAAEGRKIDVQNSLAELVAHCHKGSWMLAATLAAA